jgi:uncharacterized protein (DUF1697 family)
MAAAPRPDVHVALLRGVNVGGKRRLPMEDLAALFEAGGARDVRTLIQSGNVVFRAAASRVPALAEVVARELERRLGSAVPVVVRSGSEMRAVPRANPFLRAGADPRTLHVAFLAGRPPRPRREALDPARSPPDEIALVGREAFLRLPDGVARTRFTSAYLDATLGTVSTLRNWATVLALAERVAEATAR